MPDDNNTSSYELFLPKDAEIVSVGLIDGEVTLWIILDKNEKKYSRGIYIARTGNALPDELSLKYVGRVSRSSYYGKIECHILEYDIE